MSGEEPDNGPRPCSGEPALDWMYYLATELRYLPPMAHGSKVRHIAAQLGDLRGARCLDVGCGTGYFSGILHDKGGQVVGIDSSATAIDFARGLRPDADFRVASAFDLRDIFPSGSFDLVLCISVIEHLRDLGRLMAGIDHVLRPGGHLLISTDLEGGPWHGRAILARLEPRLRRLSKEGRMFDFMLKAKSVWLRFGEVASPHVGLLSYDEFEKAVGASFTVVRHDVFGFYSLALGEVLLKALPTRWRGIYQSAYAVKNGSQAQEAG